MSRSGWVNDELITLILPAGATSGQDRIILDGTTDQITVESADGSRIVLTISADQPSILFEPVGTTGIGILNADINTLRDNQPQAIWTSPAILPSNAQSLIELISESQNGLFHGEIQLITTDANGSITLDTKLVTITGGPLKINGKIVTGNVKNVFNGAAVVDSTASTVYVNKTGAQATTTFPKQYAATDTTLDIYLHSMTLFANALPSSIAVGVNVGGNDYDLWAQAVNVANNRYNVTGKTHITTNIPGAGNVTCTLRWKQPGGGAPTLNTNAGDWLNWSIEEVGI